MLNSWTLEFIDVLTDPNFPIHRIPEILNPTNPRLWPVCRVRRSLTNPFEALVSRSWTALPVKGPQGRGVWQVHPHPPNRRRRSASQIHLLWADGSNENWNLTSWRRLERKFSQVVHPMNRHWQAKTQIVIWTETLRKNSVTQNLTQNLITKVETFPCEGGSEESRFSWVQERHLYQLAPEVLERSADGCPPHSRIQNPGYGPEHYLSLMATTNNTFFAQGITAEEMKKKIKKKVPNSTRKLQFQC